ncbi:uncharacterized protein BX663DRAFT_433385 [Cokeromyces recurvatus]|uniref:uncharacterized protein n=1 Tax=Cokeromyces recurvatus TaxID=90255 RepID=UPI00221F006E|nr:uncharacterized protein BX663DRAFT_433385 [Cokeromyces recurvatus]KAI7903459.1 hypothetical protein BX663DRAFT_433385 [Cokeromyces recurvatus]
MFVEPSPVPRFRNVAPPPPPSPPYLNIIVHKEDPNEECIIQSPAFEDDPFTIFASTKTIHHPTPLPNTEVFNYNKHLSIEEHNTTDEQRMSLLIETLKSTIKQPKPRIYFHPPFQRGQTARLTLRNTMPEDHVIIFKFLTTHQGLKKTSGERYFVKPSAGKFSTDQLDIRVFLNQIPTELIKDELIIRWAIIQRHTEIEDWANKTLHDSNRRQWIDLLDERWPGQVIVRLTRIKIRFNNTEEMIA